MLAKRISALLMLLIIALTLLCILGKGLTGEKGFPKYNRFYYMKEYMDEVESFMKENFPLAGALKSLGLKIRMAGGQRQYHNIFIADSMLIENIEMPNAQAAANNRAALAQFVENSITPTYVMLLPTKFAIKQQELPENVALFSFNQKKYIEEVYKNLAGSATTVDVYPKLFSNYDQYIYYRTDPNLTALGAYYVYTVLAQRLAMDPLPQQDFDMHHIKHDFYGKTYELSSYTEIEPDIITLYRCNRENYNVTVTHHTDYPYTYNTMYPEHLLDLAQDTGEELRVLLGGDTGDITIKINQKREKKLLVFGDSAMMPILPLLAAHYSEIRFVDFSLWNSGDISQLDPEGYDQVLLAYSVDTMIHESFPSKIEQITEYCKKK